MPSIFSKKSNRSHPSADTTPGQLSPNPSALAVNNDDAQRYRPAEGQQSVPQSQRHSQQVLRGVSQAEYQQAFPSRTASVNRLSAHLDQAEQSYQQHQQHQQHVQQQQQPAGPQQSPSPEHARHSVYQPQSPPPVAPEQKKSLRSRIAAGLSGHTKDDDASKHAGKNGVGRRQSVRKSDARPAEDDRRLQAQQQQQWRQGSSSHLPASTEHDEDNLDPFLQQDEQPEVPPKDYPLPQQQQQFVANAQPQYRPPLDRVSTEGSYRTQGGVSQYSPDHHLHGQALQPQQQPGPQHQYQSYQPAPHTSQNPGEYHAFHPQKSPSPLVNPQAHPQAASSAPQQQHVYYQQQQEQNPELQHPQAIRAPLQLIQNQHIDAQQSQQLRPPSSQQLGPPSPLQNPPYSPYDAQPTQSSDPSLANTTPPRKSLDSMPPSASSGRNTLRKVADGQQPGAPSREASLVQPSGQASQGQPYRGEKGQAQQPQPGGDMGRATPPPRPSVADMTEEEFEKIMKEHDVLREKYQKVKRYFFEQQTQVHQLQNTLANQRLSLSRTSWDDSEYATRFNRLDGLIAQLSFSIRKDWKVIPQFLHPVVNKTAVETGKQEMTAVGRAFISHWLVENIFEKYFHPDLEPGFSTQLQMIVSNIRKFSPPSHSPEDEDSLAAKIINWRLATLEGLAETLRAPQAAKYRQELIDTLNEKLIASLQMHMNDPAPPDLNGGVPMIIELAISVAQHLPLESREVHIEYFPPGHSIVPDFMKLESGIPALTAPILEIDEADRASVRSNARSDVDNASLAEQEQLAAQTAPKEEKKRGVFGFGGGSKKPTTAPASLGKRESTLGAGGSQQSLTQNPPGSSHGPKDEAPAQRVRMAVGFAVQIRGKSILMKAPVYST